MKAIFLCDNDDEFLKLSKNHIAHLLAMNNYDSVFISGHNNLKDWVKEFHKVGIKVNLVIDCFSEVKTDEEYDLREQATINQIRIGLSNSIDGICLDAIRFYDISIKNMKSRCDKITESVKKFKSVIPYELPLYCCVKAEWSLNYYTLSFAAKLYGQDYKAMSQYANLMPMCYRNLYNHGCWKVLNPVYNEGRINETISNHTNKYACPFVWAYNCTKEYSYNRMPTNEELNQIHELCEGNFTDFLLRDMIIKGNNLIELI